MIRDTIFSLQRQYLSDDRLCISESLSDKCEPTGQIQPCPIKVPVDVTDTFSLSSFLPEDNAEYELNVLSLYDRWGSTYIWIRKINMWSLLICC